MMRKTKRLLDDIDRLEAEVAKQCDRATAAEASYANLDREHRSQAARLEAMEDRARLAKADQRHAYDAVASMNTSYREAYFSNRWTPIKIHGDEFVFEVEPLGLLLVGHKSGVVVKWDLSEAGDEGEVLASNARLDVVVAVIEDRNRRAIRGAESFVGEGLIAAEIVEDPVEASDEEPPEDGCEVACDG